MLTIDETIELSGIMRFLSGRSNIIYDESENNHRIEIVKFTNEETLSIMSARVNDLLRKAVKIENLHFSKEANDGL